MVKTAIKESRKLIEPIENAIVLRNVHNAVTYRDQLDSKCAKLVDIVDHVSKMCDGLSWQKNVSMWRGSKTLLCSKLNPFWNGAEILKIEIDSEAIVQFLW